MFREDAYSEVVTLDKTLDNGAEFKLNTDELTGSSEVEEMKLDD